MKIPEKVQSLPADGKFYSLEYFPPKTQTGLENLQQRLARMSKGLKPLFASVTWGTGGSTADKSLELAVACQQQHGMTACLHLTCTNMDQTILDSTLEQAKEAGIQNILALRGDPPRGEEYYTPSSDQFEYAIDLVRYIRTKYGDYFAIGVAAYPEGHVDGADEDLQDPAKDIPFLLEKVKAGADFIVTQLFYDVDVFVRFENTLRQHPSGLFKNITLIPCVMPIQSYPTLRRLSKLSHAKVPARILEMLEPLKGDDGAVKAAGVEIATDMIKQILEKTSGRIRGFHFCTLNLEKSVSFILEKSGLLAEAIERHENQSDNTDGLKPEVIVDGTVSPIDQGQNGLGTHRKSSALSDPSNKMIVDKLRQNLQHELQINNSKPSKTISDDLIQSNINLAVSEGEGSLGRQATWDDFPNGRFGDPRSPAFGEIDGYGPTLHLPPFAALKAWGFPVEDSDITTLFTDYLNRKLDTLPWSDEGLSDETHLIKDQLYKLNQKQWWTVGSQPPVNGVRSSDPVLGWGPPNGWVFQKAFVEFFVSTQDLESLIQKINTYEGISFYASNAAGELKSNMAEGQQNAVTWGVFPGKEIIAPTIIETESFLAWKQEAFLIWDEWSRLYPKGSPSHNYVQSVYASRWLITIVDHDFQQTRKIWELLEVA